MVLLRWSKTVWNYMQMVPNSLVQQPQQKIALPFKKIPTTSVCGQQPGRSSSTHAIARSCISVQTISAIVTHMVDSGSANMPIQSPKEEHGYLGVTIDDNLKFHSHCWDQAAKANNVLGLIKHSVTSCQTRVIKKIYTDLVHPICSEFGISVANPQCKCEMKKLEKV